MVFPAVTFTRIILKLYSSGEESSYQRLLQSRWQYYPALEKPTEVQSNPERREEDGEGEQKSSSKRKTKTKTAGLSASSTTVSEKREDSAHSCPNKCPWNNQHLHVTQERWEHVKGAQ